MNLFDIVGPVMVGPSSSHTAGAVRIGFVAQKLLGEPVKRARIGLYGSFLATGTGHGTQKALIAGVLGMAPVIIKFVFQDAVRKNKSANYICVNLFQATAPEDIQDRSICIAADCGRVIEDLLAMSKNK